ncbi:MAG: hypothetical protein ACRDFX_12610 [Chloroflexota bacterium]
MYSPEPGTLSGHDLTQELKASVRARRELTGEMEDQLLEAFLARIEQRIDTRVQGMLSHRKPPARSRLSSRGTTPWVAISSFALAIPLSIVAASTTPNGVGIVPVMVAVLLVNLMYVANRWHETVLDAIGGRSHGSDIS